MNVEVIASQTVSFSRHGVQRDWKKNNFRGSCSCFPR